MPLISAVESHPQRSLIVESLLAGRSLRSIGKSVSPPLSATVLQRYRQKHIDPTLEGAQALSSALKTLAESSGTEGVAIDPVRATRAALLADPYLTRIAKHQATIDTSLKDAAEAKDGRTVAALIATDLKGLELDARLTHRLDGPSGPTVAIQIIVPAGSSHIQVDDGPVVDIG